MELLGVGGEVFRLIHQVHNQLLPLQDLVDIVNHDALDVVQLLADLRDLVVAVAVGALQLRLDAVLEVRVGLVGSQCLGTFLVGSDEGALDVGQELEGDHSAELRCTQSGKGVEGRER